MTAPIIFNPKRNVLDLLANLLRKSKQAHYRFIYHYFNGDVEEAEKALLQIRSNQMKVISYLMLLSKQKRYNVAKELLYQMKDNVYKW
jgi:Tat protein secretion system quality control protein TatD with DNase activity